MNRLRIIISAQWRIQDFRKGAGIKRHRRDDRGALGADGAVWVWKFLDFLSWNSVIIGAFWDVFLKVYIPIFALT